MDSTTVDGITWHLGSGRTQRSALRGSEERIRRVVLSGVLALLLAAASLLAVAGSAPVALAGKPYYTCSRTDPGGNKETGWNFGSRKQAAAWEASTEAGGYWTVECWRVHP